jgi:hypothetical protein
VQPLGVCPDLPDAVPRGDHRQDRLIKRPADDLHAARRDQPRQSLDVFRVPLLDPFQQRPAGVQCDWQVVLLEDIQERPIRVAIRLFKDAVEVSDRLMIVQDQAKAERIHGPAKNLS